MTARLVRLRIAGFKSFAEPVSLDILPGLTGIVGPNGCGKSNVADALRWAMGETSARSMRGGEMDDLIFAGTAARASRNLAEVSISLQAGSTPLPAPFEAEAELQVTRRIERGAGSSFAGNGRELRARDVQTLYADLASGARSSGMVSQGRVAALVGARPEERRQVLDEAAGIAGLHARRHEAELKLRAAEQNLARAEDLRTQLAAARDGLQKQARQAGRYRTISDLIRGAEAQSLAIQHGRAAAARTAAKLASSAAQTALQAAVSEHETVLAALAEAEAALPHPRQREAEARALLERRRLEAETLAETAQRAEADAAQAAERLRELSADIEAAQRAREDASASVTRLTHEYDRLAADLASLPPRIEAADVIAREAAVVLADRQAAADRAAALAADAAHGAARAEADLRAATTRVQALARRHEAAQAELAACEAVRIAPEMLADAAGRLAHAVAALDAARACLDEAEVARQSAGGRAAEASQAASQQRAIRAEAERVCIERASRLEAADRAWSAASEALAALQRQRIDPDRLSQEQSVAQDAEAALALADQAIEAADHAAGAARQALAETRRQEAADLAAWHAAERGREAALARRALVAGQVDDAGRLLAQAEAEGPSPQDLEQILGRQASADAALDDALATLGRLKAAQAAARATSTHAGTAHAEAHARQTRLAAEAAGLDCVLGPEIPGAVLDSLVVSPGFEAAVGAALGAAADASLDETAPLFWRALPACAGPAMPAGAAPLAEHVQCPPPLRRALSYAVLLDGSQAAEIVQSALSPGMVAVDRDGGCWRWDGLVVRSGSASQAALRLGLRHRRQALAVSLARAAEDAARTVAVQAEADRRAELADIAVTQVQITADEALAERQAALQMSEQAQAAAVRRQSRIAGLRQSAATCMAELREADRILADAARAMGELTRPDPSRPIELETEMAACQSALDAARLARAGARVRAADTRMAAQALAGEAGRIAALMLAASDIVQRAEAERGEARRMLAASQAVLGNLPALAGLEQSCAALAEQEGNRRLAETSARAARQAAETAVEEARASLGALRLQADQVAARVAALRHVAGRDAADLEAGERAWTVAQAVVDGLPDLAALNDVARDALSRLDPARQDRAQAEHSAASLHADLAQAGIAAPQVEAERAAWQTRLDEAGTRCMGLASRHETARRAHQAFASRPAELAGEAARLDQALAAAAATHQAALAALEAAHGRVRALAGAERDAIRQCGQLQERVARAQSAVEAAHAQMHAVSVRMSERLGAACPLPDAPDLSDQVLEKATRRIERLTRERQEMGPVNLRAELEVAELDERLAALGREQEELTSAIAKLRGAVGHLNREGRERLRAVFSQVDQHFGALFTRMMGGGRAHLAWTGSDDPLEAGLDIFAEPPGKKLASLSLLSGGEQALTALSLIFAVFRCTPAPICVLDEVDAPLDDANVDRFCTLLEEMARETGTSFLVVTHHQLTMSRMDRLYGVTMQERGVSRLLSVNLSRALVMVEPVRVAAE